MNPEDRLSTPSHHNLSKDVLKQATAEAAEEGAAPTAQAGVTVMAAAEGIIKMLT